MKPVLIVGMTVVNIALICYTLAFYLLSKNRILTKKAFRFQLIGVCFDIFATVCMIIGSSKSPFSLHGILGYSSLLGMIIDTYLLNKQRTNKGFGVVLSPKIKLYSRIAYIWWLFAYVTGAAIIMLRSKTG